MSVDPKAKFQKKLDREMAWRRKELTALYLHISSQDAAIQGVLKKAFICLLYAHYEGFVKESLKLIVKFISNSGLKYVDLNRDLAFFGIRSEIIKGVPKKTSPIHRFSTSIQKIPGSVFDVSSEGAIDTESNLTSELFDSFLNIFRIDKTAFELRYNYLDLSILGVRNRIAHGEYVKPDEIDLDASYEAIKNVLQDFKDAAIQYIEDESFRHVEAGS